MNTRQLLIGAAGAAGLAATLAFAPLTWAQQTPAAPASATVMYSARQGGGGNGACDGTNFVDENGDGVCDNAGTGAGQGRRAGFVDENGDGVCDNAGTGAGQRGQGQRGRGRP